MAPEKTVTYEGIKTFVLAPDLSLMPEDFLPQFFLRGYEVYYILEDRHLDLYSKVRVLFELFPELILFFNIDRKLIGMSWPAMVRQIKDKHGDKARMGVIYGSLVDLSTRRELEKTYLYDIGIHCGCIPMEYRKTTNLDRLLQVLAANQANGRRKSLRAICDSSCTVNLVHHGLQHVGRIRDISISHFSCVFTDGEPKLVVHQKLPRVQLRLAGIICTVDVMLCAKRPVPGATLYVFVFYGANGREGLSPDVRVKINNFVYGHFRKHVGEIIQKGVEQTFVKAKTG